MGEKEQRTRIGRDQDKSSLHQGIKDSLDDIEFTCVTILRVYVDDFKVAEWPITDKTVKGDMESILKDTIYRSFNPTVEQIMWINDNKDLFNDMVKEMSEELWNKIIRHISYYNNIINKGEIK